MAGSDPDSGIDPGNQGNSFVTTVGGGLGPHGLPVLNATGMGILHDFDPVSGELLWWSTKNPNISVLNSPVYPAHVTLPFVNNAMFPNSTAFGVDGDNVSGFLTAKFAGHLHLSQTGSISFDVCSDDDALVYLSGGIFQGGTLVMDNAGIHGSSCSAPNVNANMLKQVPAGDYKLKIFYADRLQEEATLSISLSTGPGNLLDCNVPEPSSLVLAGAGVFLLLCGWPFRGKSKG